MKLELKLTGEFEDDVGSLYTYKIGKYDVDEKFVGCCKYFSINGNGRYVPAIYFKPASGRSGESAKFIINPCGYGDLNKEEFKELVEEYKEALEVVEILTEEFINN